MPIYYVNDTAQSTGEHEVHKSGCAWMPSNKTYLGDFSNCQQAVQKAKDKYNNVDGCKHCCETCHTR